MILPLTNKNVSDDNYSVSWDGNDVLIRHNLNSKVVCQAYDGNYNLFHLLAENIDFNTLKLSFSLRPDDGVIYRILIKPVSNFSFNHNNKSGEDVSCEWSGNHLVFYHNYGSDVFVQLWNNLKELVNLPVYKNSNNSFEVDFSHTNKPTGVGFWEISFYPTDSFSLFDVNGSNDDFSWSWVGDELIVEHGFGRYPFIQVYDGVNELVGWSVQSIGNNRFSMSFSDTVKPSPDGFLVLVGEADTEESFGSYYFASGYSQFNPFTDAVEMALIPAFGDYRQYFMMTRQDTISPDGVNYHFQVSTDYNFNVNLYNVEQSTDVFDGSVHNYGGISNHGNVFFVPAGRNLKSGNIYYWRVRYSNHKNASNNWVFFDWSKKFPFYVNKIPSKPNEIVINTL